MADQTLKFSRKRNTNGTFDLTCPFCYMTIAFGALDSEIDDLERVHGCWEQDRAFFDQLAVKKQA
jgi:hypothetical protein